ncbi:SulP family inorganic anion transporter [Agromyces seonyuensis]|uniref:STAS domain-containing protein n=1 Tax=Agromyces seonyuensis TaxID=2662446 RepID=A0A6I4P1M7_9MICO|nr:SulP family inorganic anion transporter [Agromyces seonyuensis]MWB97929.1 STAS domain-containing protein [Agromyces seonyuensis]
MGLRDAARTAWGGVRGVFRKETIGKDAVAGVVLGVEAIPDGLASGLLAGLNPLAGVYAYLFGLLGATWFTSSTLMAVQATSAMSLVIADTGIGAGPDPAGALVVLGLLTGLVMIIAGVLGGGRLLRFVPTAVMTGFVTAVGVNIVLGQLANFTGAEGEGGNRLTRSVDLILHVGRFDWPTVLVGAVTAGLVVWLTRSRLRSLGLVVAVVTGSALTAALDAWAGTSIAVVQDVAPVAPGLPGPVLPDLSRWFDLLLPALSLSFVALIQGAAVSDALPNPDGRRSDASRDFVGQGAGSVLAGLFQGMPVGGTMSGSSIVAAAGARTKLALFIAAGTMATLLLVASGLVAYVAMPALAALLIVVGISSIKPARIRSVLGTGPFQTAVMAVTFVLTLVIPLQFAVLVGVGLGILLFVAEQSNGLRVRQLDLGGDGRLRERAPDPELPARTVVVLQPYGSLFFASAPVFERALPAFTPTTTRSVVIVRLRGVEQIGLSLVGVLRRYAHELADRDSRLVLVVSEEKVLAQLDAGGLLAELGPEGLVRSGEWVTEGVRRAYAEASEWVERG